MPVRTLQAILCFLISQALLVAAPLPKPRGKEPEPDVITSAGKYERFDGKVTIDLWQADDGHVEIGIETPEGTATHTLKTKSADFWALQVESKEQFWVYGDGKLHQIKFKDDKTASISIYVGPDVMKSAPKGLRDAILKDLKERRDKE